MQRRMLSKEDEESAAASEVEVRREDQEKINKFSRLHQRQINLEQKLEDIAKEKSELDDVEVELELMDDEKVPYRIGDAFFMVPATRAVHMVNAAANQKRNEIIAIEKSLDEIGEEMSQLKVELYARFGRSINLEA